MNDSKVKVPLIFTGLNILTYLMPFIALFPLLFGSTMFTGHLDVDIPGLICIIVFIIILFIELIMMFLTPLIQFSLIIVAIINKKWWLLSIHIPLTILFVGGSYVFYSWFSNLSV